MDHQKFVLIFIFDKGFKNVLLIHKNRPDWQKGKLNGLGGKIEKGETPKQAIVREVSEEAGLKLNLKSVKKMGVVGGKDWRMHVFIYLYPGNLKNAKSMTDEKVTVVTCSNLPKICLSNLSWMIPMCIDILENKRIRGVKVSYEDH